MKIILFCLLATSCISALADNINYMGTTYLPHDIAGSWSTGAGRTPCYTCKIKETMFSFTAGAANIAPLAFKKAKKVHILQINTSEKQSIRVFKRKRTDCDSYVIQLGSELFFFKEDTKSIFKCTPAFLADTKELQYATLKHGYLLDTSNGLVIYD